jgi:SSS family transporter
VIFAVWLGAATLPADAESISSIGIEHLPTLTDRSLLSGLVVLDGRAVAVQSSGAWILDDARQEWIRSGSRQPEGLVASVAGADGQGFLVSGRDDAAVVERVSRISLNGGQIDFDELPPLPVSLVNAFATPGATSLHVAGIDATAEPLLLELPLSSGGAWLAHPGWPGGGVPTSSVVQNAVLYLTATTPDRLQDRLLRWSSNDGWRDLGGVPGSVHRGAARALGQAHVLYLVRDSEGSTSLMTFHTISRAWASVPYKAPANVVRATSWGNGMLLALDAGDRFAFEAVELESNRQLLAWVDWTVIGVYLAAMLGVGLYFHWRSQRSAAEFFVGNRSIPVWAAGISLYATNTSSISYVAIPAKSFETDWTYLSNNLITVLGLMFVATWIVPLLRRLDLVSVFSYLEIRFHPAIRMLASALCILMQVGSRMSVVLFLPALAIAAITGIDVVWSILIMGVCTVIYTALGGMRAVIWTDCLQVVVMFGGALFAMGFVVYTLGGASVLEIAAANDKTRLFDFSFDLTQATIWGFLVLTLLDVVLTFPKDQVLVQRALATTSDRSAGRSIWLFAAMTIPGGFIFYAIGTVLFAYYQSHPERLDALLPIDATFPLFIAAELPVGVTGLIIAGIFAAAMSTLSSTINSVATLLSVDFYGRFARNATPGRSLRFAEWASVVVGLVGIGLALLLSRYNVRSLLDTSIELFGLLGGGFGGAYTLGMFTTRANSPGVAIGVVSALVVTLIAWMMDLVHPYFYLGISILTCIVVGYVASLAFPASDRSLAGLTIRTGGRTEAKRSIPSS